MIPNVFQSIDKVIEAADPRQKILWSEIRLLTGQAAAVRTLLYVGASAGSEFLTYSANKLYLALSISMAGYQSAAATFNYMQFYDPANAFFYNTANQALVWNTTAAAVWYVANENMVDNIYFSRIVVSGYANIKFIGYRIAY